MTTLTFELLHRRFNEMVASQGITWRAVGFLAPDDMVYAFGTDTKVISTVFECCAAPLIGEIAEEYGYTVEGSPQTIYPDFTLSPATRQDQRIAVDIKTTYRTFNQNGLLQKFKYTLGSYTSFLRSPGATKNIKYPYAQYSDHWVIGFLYTRVEGVPAKVYRREQVEKLTCPYKDVDYFIQEKYKIAGESPGSGNTTNIGSFPTNNMEDLRQGRGPFAKHGKEVCDDYWRHYGTKAPDREYGTVAEYLVWVKRKS